MSRQAPIAAVPFTADSAFGNLVDDLIARIQAGERIDWPAAERDHPEHAEGLRAVRPALSAIADLSRSGEPALNGVGTTSGGEDGLFTGVLGDFRIIREVGRGGMGVVYEAEQVSLGRRVALKVLPFAATMDPRQLQRFRHEAQAAAMLHHANIVPVYGVGCERGVHYYAMQLIQGHSLAAVIDGLRCGSASGGGTPHGPVIASGASGASGTENPPAPADHTASYQPAEMFPLAPPGTPGEPAAPTAAVAALSTQRTRKDKAHCRRIAELGAQAADALEYAHSMGVVHRDVKPANLMLDDGGHLWVTDFGLAKLDAAANLTVSGDLLGTLRYMSPEQALARHGLVDHRTDLYSLGATLYELLTLRPAVDGQDKHEVLKKIAFEEPTAPRKLDKAIPAELETITLKALAKNPNERYATAGELAEDLRRWLADKAIRAKPPTIGQRAGKWARRHRPAVATVIGLLVVALVAVSSHNLMLTREQGRTRERFEWARDAVNSMYTQVAEDWLADAPRLTPVQEQFLTRALEFYERFSAEHGDDPAVQREAVVVQVRVGRMHAKVGRNADAETAFRRSLDQAERLAAAGADPAFRTTLALACYDYGAFLHDLSRNPEAEPLLIRARDLREALAAEAPELPGHWPDLALAHNDLGRLRNNTGRREEAEDSHRRALEIRTRLADAFPKEGAFQSVVGGSLHNLALLRRTDDPAEALRLLDRAIVHQQAARATDPRRVQYRVFLRNHHEGRSAALRMQHRYVEAEQALSEAAVLTRALVADFPEVLDYRNSLTFFHLTRGSVLAQNGRLGDAVEAFREARNQSHQLAMRAPDSLRYQALAASALTNFADSLCKLGKATSPGPQRGGLFGEAEQSSREAVAIHERLAAQAPNDPDQLRVLAEKMHSLARLLHDRGAIDEARTCLAKAIEHQLAALDARPLHGGYRSALRAYYSVIVNDWRPPLGPERTAAYEGMDQVYGRLVARYERLAAEFPDDPEYLSAAGATANDWALFVRQRGQPEHARPLLDRAIRHQLAVVATRPGQPLYRANLRNHYLNLADLLADLGQFRPAEEAYAEAASLSQALADDFPREPEYRQRLADILSRLGQMFARPRYGPKRPWPAERTMRQAVATAERLVADFGDRYSGELITALDNFALVLQLVRRDDDAEGPMRRSVALQEKLVARRPESPAVRGNLGARLSNLGMGLSNRGAYAEAREVLERAIEQQQAALRIHPDNAIYCRHLASHYALLAQAAYRQGQYRDAREAYDSTLRIRPDNVFDQAILAWLLATDPDTQRRDPSRAATLAEEAIARRPWLDTAWESLGAAAYRMGRWADAASAVERAIAIDPDGIDFFLLAMARWQLGETDKARRWYDHGMRWVAKHQPRDGSHRFHRPPAAEIERVRAEAAALLGVVDPPPPK